MKNTPVFKRVAVGMDARPHRMVDHLCSLSGLLGAEKQHGLRRFDFDSIMLYGDLRIKNTKQVTARSTRA